MDESALEGWVPERLNLGISSKREKTNKKMRKQGNSSENVN